MELTAERKPLAHFRIIAFAPACDPSKGSEPGSGWALVRMLAQVGDTTVLTVASNKKSIEEALESIPERDNLRFVHIELPGWARFLRRLKRRVYGYLLWQVVALHEARQLHSVNGYDLVWHCTWSTVWLGSVAGFVGPPFVYGPVSGGVGTCWSLLPALGIQGALYEIRRIAFHVAGRYLNPFARAAWRSARLILVHNPETRNFLPRRYRAKTEVLPSMIISEDLAAAGEGNVSRNLSGPKRPPTALFAGRLIPSKGIALAIHVLTYLPEWRLTICGSGPDQARLVRLSRRIGVEQRVAFTGWKPRRELLRIMKEECDVFLFPSIHEEGGWVVAEALSSGLPVICLDRGGPPVLGGKGVSVGSLKETTRALAHAAASAFETSWRNTDNVGRPLERERLMRLLEQYGLLPVG